MKKIFYILPAILFILSVGFFVTGSNGPGNPNNDVAFYNYDPGMDSPNAAGDTLYTFIIPNQLILGVCELPQHKLVFSSGGQSSAVTTDNKWIVTTLTGQILDTTHLQINNTSGQGFGFRDLAWNGRWILASDNATVRKIDTTTFTELLPGFTGPNNPERGLSASTPNRVWSSNFTTGPIVLMDTLGVQVKTLGIPTVAPYGLGEDKYSTSGRMWLWMQEPSTSGVIRFTRIDTSTGATGTSYTFAYPNFTVASSGGVDIVNDFPAYPGKVIAILVVQNSPTSEVIVLDLGASLVGVDPSKNTIPTDYTLSQNYPNPFNPTTQIKFSVPEAGDVKLTVFDITGKEVTTLLEGYRKAGNYSVNFSASNLSSGLYLYKLETKNFTDVKKMVLVK